MQKVLSFMGFAVCAGSALAAQPVLSMSFLSVKNLPTRKMKVLKGILTVLAIFAPFIMFGYAVMKIPNGLQVIGNWGLLDWMWLIMLGAMMLGLYYLLSVFFIEEEEIEEDFERIDRDHDGFVTQDDASRYPGLAKVFAKFDVDHDGKLSRVEFEEFEHSLPRG